MFVKKALLIIGVAALLSSCQSRQNPQVSNSLPPNVHKVIVEDILQTNNYTYLQVKENVTEQWLAVPSMQAKTGETYYYQGGLQMSNFESKELKRTFDKVLFLEKVSPDPSLTDKIAPNSSHDTASSPTNTSTAPADQSTYTRTAPVIEKKEIKVAAVKGGITIAELFSKKESLSGKTVKIKGEVTKFTPAVMGKNWIHLQDGTEANNKFDLVVTSDAEVNVGDQIIAEGKISLNKDLGYGYFFEVIMEDASLKK